MIALLNSWDTCTYLSMKSFRLTDRIPELWGDVGNEIAGGGSFFSIVALHHWSPWQSDYFAQTSEECSCDYSNSRTSHIFNHLGSRAQICATYVPYVNEFTHVSTLTTTWDYSSLAKLPSTFLRDLCTLILLPFQHINRLKLHFLVPVVPLRTRKLHRFFL